MIRVLINASSRYPADRQRIRALVKKILGEYGQEREVEISILFAGDRKMKQLNSAYRQVKETTDVLSFPLKEADFPDKVIRFGDVVISYPQARKQAQELNLTVDEEIDRLIEHGLLSLLGLKK